MKMKPHTIWAKGLGERQQNPAAQTVHLLWQPDGDLILLYHPQVLQSTSSARNTSKTYHLRHKKTFQVVFMVKVK